MNDIRDKEILNRIKNGIAEAPIDLLDNLKNQTVVKMMEHDDITRQEKERKFQFHMKPIMSFASVAAVFLLVFFNFQQLRVADSEIFLDVNPAIHITTNKKDNVINLEAINQEAARIINEIDYKGEDLNTVTDKILDSLLSLDYIEKEDEIILLSVFNKDKDKGKRQTDELNDVIHEKLDSIDRRPVLLTQSLDKSNTIEEMAKEYGISVGKMTFIRNMIILNPDLKTEDLIKLSLTELIEISQDTGIEIDRILDSQDMDKIRQPSEPMVIPDDYDDYDDDYDDDDNDDDYRNTAGSRSLIGEARAREIALSLVSGNILEFEIELDIDDDEAIYEIEIETDGYEYEIEIDAYSGKVLEFEKDD